VFVIFINGIWHNFNPINPSAHKLQLQALTLTSPGGGQLEISPGKLSKINMEPACIRIFVGYPHFKSIFSICNQFNFNDRAFAWSLVNGSWLDG